MKDKREVYIDILRILATLAVITIHVGGEHWMSTNVFSFQWDMFNFYRAISRWAVPMFIMISGTLFLGRNEIDVRKLYMKNLFRIIVAYVFWSIIYALYFYDGSMVNFIKSVIRGPGHMWFMFLIAAIYVVMPLIKRIVDRMGTKIVIIFIVIGFFVSSIPLFVYDITSSSFMDERIIMLIKICQKIFGWSGYLCLGWWLSKHKIERILRYIIYVIGIVAIIESIFVFRWYAYGVGYAPNEIYDNISVTVMAECIALYVLAKECKYKISDKWINVIKYISKCTFGVYLVHMLIFYLVDGVISKYLLSFPLLMLPLVVLGVFILSLLISMGLNKIPFINKYIV